MLASDGSPGNTPLAIAYSEARGARLAAERAERAAASGAPEAVREALHARTCARRAGEGAARAVRSPTPEGARRWGRAVSALALGACHAADRAQRAARRVT